MGKEPPGDSEATSLYAKLFINGFSRPCHVVLVAELSSLADPTLVEQSLRDCLELEPRLRSLVELSRLGVPVRFRHRPVAAWLEAGCFRVMEGFDLTQLHAFRQEALDAPMDLEREPPLRVWLLQGEGRSAIVVKVHHAVFDARTSRPILLRFVQRHRARASGRTAPLARAPRPSGRADPRPWAARAWEWLRTARLEARVPEVSLLAETAPGAATTQATRCVERVLPMSELTRITEDAARAGLTFPQHFCAAALRAFGAYNARRARGGRRAPPRVGLMVATSRRPSATRPDDDAPSVDSILLSAEEAMLDPKRRGELGRHVRAALQQADRRHNGLLLWAFYASRRLRALGGTAPTPDSTTVHVLYSDASSLATSFRRPLELSPGLHVERLHYVATPVARDQAMLLTYAYGNELRVGLMHEDGMLCGEELLADLDAELRAPEETQP